MKDYLKEKENKILTEGLHISQSWILESHLQQSAIYPEKKWQQMAVYSFL